MTARKQPRGSTDLETARAVLIQNQTRFVGQMAKMQEGFERIEAYLIRHERLLAALPEAIREKIGFQSG